MDQKLIEQLRANLHYMRSAERVARLLCRRSGLVEGFEWGAMRKRRDSGEWRSRPSAWHRSPPLPFHSFRHLGPGYCRVCGQPVFGKGFYRAKSGPPSKQRTWHDACLSAYMLWTKPNDYAAILILRQGQRCTITGDPIMLPYPRGVEVDHDVPLFRAARQHREEPWFELLRFWGFGNLRAVSRAGHLQKCAAEARERAGRRSSGAEQGVML